MRACFLLIALTGFACGTEFADSPVPDATSPDAEVGTSDVASDCGDGVVQAGEECDDGARNSDVASDSCRTDCRFAFCGDSVVDDGEACDGGEWCSDGCLLLTGCGDGIVQSDEDCDDGNALSGDGCAADCTLEAADVCGDGVLSAGEECDDGNGESGDGCAEDCTAEPPVCGDGVVAGDEECDDGNEDPADACTNECTAARCGDGILQADEECDDGNDDPADGCSHLCRLPGCGDGIRQSGESCDAGPENGTADSECRSDCSMPLCGDGTIDGGESCDDGDPVAEGCYLCGRLSSRVTLVNLIGDARTVSLLQPERALGEVVGDVASPGAAVAVPLIAGSQLVDLAFSDGTFVLGLESHWPMGPSDHYSFVVLPGSPPEVLVIREDESTPPDGFVRIRVINAVQSDQRVTVADADREFASETILFGSRFGSRSPDATRPPGDFRVEVIAQDMPGVSWTYDLGELEVGADHSIFVMGTMDGPVVIRTATSGEIVVASPEES